MRHNFKELKVWKSGRSFVKSIYETTQLFPSEERFGLQSQIRRASVSIISNIAEGSGKGTDRDFRNYLKISLGSAYEVESNLIISNDLGFIKDEDYRTLDEELNQIQKMLYGLIKTLT